MKRRALNLMAAVSLGIFIAALILLPLSMICPYGPTDKPGISLGCVDGCIILEKVVEKSCSASWHPFVKPASSWQMYGVGYYDGPQPVDFTAGPSFTSSQTH